MKNKNLIFTVLISLIIIILCSNIESIYGEENLVTSEESENLYNSEGMIKVNFYYWNKKSDQKEEYIGTAELKEGKLVYEVKDKRLEKMLEGDFNTMVIVEEGDKSVNKLVTYIVGTIEHLNSVIEHCKDISCIAEIVSR